jgi:methionyl-tRNA formyltransferase
MQSFALSNGVPFESMKTGEEEKVENWVRGCNPDLLVVYSMSSLLPAIIFSIPPLGAINMHPSWLPDYRGPNPYFWQCFDQLEEFGLTIHQVTAGEDAGSILAQVRVPMVFGLKKEERMKMLIEQKGVPLLLKTLEDIAANEVAVSEQPKKSPTRRAKRITADEARELVNWETWPTLRIWNLLRATEGDLAILPSPFRYVPGFRWSMGECVSTIKQSKPGEIVHNRGRFYLQCRDGSIQLKIKFSFKNII